VQHPPWGSAAQPRWARRSKEARRRSSTLSSGSCAELRGVLLAALFLVACAGLRPPFPETVPIHHAAASGGTLRAGAAAVDITPSERVWMGGYGFWRRSEGVHDPLYARALVLEQGELQLALVALDVVGVQREDLLPLRQQLESEGFDPRQLVIAATHNHSGPDTIGLWGLPPLYSGRSAAYMRRLESGVLEALRRARAALRPAELAAGGVEIDPRGVLRARGRARAGGGRRRQRRDAGRARLSPGGSGLE
jgi:hypothetical protein